MIRRNSLEVSENLFFHEQLLFSYITVTFIAPVVFLCRTNNRNGYSHRSIFFHGCSIFGKRFYFLYKANWIFGHSYSYWVLATVMLKSLNKFLPGKWPRALSYIHDSSSLACWNSYCVHHNVSNTLRPLSVFGRESCLKLCYPLE